MKTMKNFKKMLLLLPLLAATVLFQNCSENIDTSSRYVFTGNTILSYLQSHDSVYSEYLLLLDTVKISDQSKSKVAQVLSARGNYTCFAPTNEAIANYLVLLKDSGIISEPTWDAPEFYTTTGEPSDLLTQTQEEIVLNSLIDGGDDIEAYTTSDFSERSDGQLLGLANMLDNKLKVTKVNTDYATYAIDGSPVSAKNCDIYTINGRIHQVNKVIAPSTQTLGSMFNDLLSKGILNDNQFGLYVYAALTELCGLNDTLQASEDEQYYKLKMDGTLQNLPNHNTEGKPGYLPEHRYIGFTLFAESGKWWKGVDGMNDLCNELVAIKADKEMTTEEKKERLKEIKDQVIQNAIKCIGDNNYFLSDASKGEDYTSTDNYVNQFVTYHLLPEKIEQSKLVIHFNELWYNITTKQKKATVYEWYTTMGQRRLLKTYETTGKGSGVVSLNNKIFLNRFPVLNNGRHDDFTEKSCADDKQGLLIGDNQKVYNAYIYTLEEPLYYNETTQSNMASERIRMDVSTFFPELMTNDIRANENQNDENLRRGFPKDNEYQYLADCNIGGESRFYYLSGRNSKTSSWHNYQGDELNVIGQYEMTMKLPPVPKDGIYEIRFGASCSQQRGMCQVYFGTNKNALPAAGIPLDLRKGGRKWYLGSSTLDSGLGWEEDDENDDEVNIEMDKKLRNNNIMKAPNSYYRVGQSITMREEDDNASYGIIRRIIIRRELKANETYYIQFKSVLEDTGSQFYMDYIEYCPKEIYDNPTNPEDIW